MSALLIIVGVLGVLGMWAAQGRVIYGEHPAVWTVVMLASGGLGVCAIGMGVSGL